MLGGTIVPVPPLGLLTMTTDAVGEMSLTIPGGGGPLTIYAQAVVLDPGSTTAPVHISNAIEAYLLP